MTMDTNVFKVWCAACTERFNHQRTKEELAKDKETGHCKDCCGTDRIAISFSELIKELEVEQRQ